GLGADCNLSRFTAKWPTATVYEMNDAGATLIPAYDPIVGDLANTTWGAIGYTCDAWSCDPVSCPRCLKSCSDCTSWLLHGNTCPVLDGIHGLNAWNPGLTVQYNAQTLTTAFKSLTDDTLDATMNGFANGLGC